MTNKLEQLQAIYARFKRRSELIVELQAESQRITNRIDEMKRVQRAMDKEAEDDQKLLEKIT